MALTLVVGGTLLLAPPARAAVQTFQEDVGGYIDTQDTYLDEQFPDTSHNSSRVRVENNAGARQQGLIRFDNIFGSGPGQIPFDSVINSATLTVNVTNDSAAGAQIRLHRMLMTWPETATWNSMTGGIQTNDTEAMSAFDAQVSDPDSTGPEPITGLAAALQAWSDGASNYGWAIISNSSNGWDFASSEDPTPGNHPLLQVDWSPPPLEMVKRAFWPDGTPIPTGATIPSGVGFKYLLYINNQNIARSDISVRDVLDPAFQYQLGTIQVDNSVAECVLAVCTAVEEQAIFTAVDGATVLSDAADSGDVASYTGASLSVDAGNGTEANLQLDINADMVWAMLFSVKMP